MNPRTPINQITSPPRAPELVPRTFKRQAEPRSLPKWNGNQINGTMNPPSQEKIPFSESRTSFAVDISGSTAGKIMHEERAVVREICDQFSSTAKQKTKILPWNHKPHSILSYQQITHLSSAGGTDPTILNSDNSFKLALRDSTLWFLLTDGLIEPPVIKEFALGIGNKGLHGTACVIILFGNKNQSPVECNTSVGLSVFAAAPDCLFLFHDITTSTPYIFQCKGCFLSLLPQGTENPILSPDTRWHHLPQINYRDLARLDIPAPRKLGYKELALHDGKVVSLDDLYSDRLDEAVVNEILSNDDDLKSVLLTSSSRGLGDNAERWVSTKRINTADPLRMPRPDLGGRAFDLTKQLLKLMTTDLQTSGRMMKHPHEQIQLRQAHIANWRAFSNMLDSNQRASHDRNSVVSNAIDRLSSTKSGRGLSSPSSMSPVTPSMGYTNTPQLAMGNNHYYINQIPSTSQYTMSPYESPCIQMTASSSYHGSHSNLYQNPYETPKYPHLLYTTGFQKRSAMGPNSEFIGECQICGDSTRPLALLLRAPPTNMKTPAFPARQSRSRLAFPLAMGNFPETDIISSFVCCDPCSWFMVRHGTTLKEDTVLGALPLVDYGGNRLRWLSALDSALSERFEKSELELLFLAVLYTAVEKTESVDSEESTVFLRALQWTIDNIQRSVSVHPSLSASLPDGVPSIPFSSALSQGFMDLQKPNCPLLRYPLEGFTIIIRAASDLATAKLTEFAVFQRFLHHLTEQHWNYRNTAKEDVATATLSRLLEKCQLNSESEHALSISVPSLVGTPLLSEDALEAFEKLGGAFETTKTHYGPAIAVFLHYLVLAAPESDTPTECFDWIKNQSNIGLVFFEPVNITVTTAGEMVANIMH
ncbi:hypothetical protein K440DRAFT_657722 [Wilcoxina mikolae CBS 423.85]|nr:hypothetical protein K440DRAFT_657722 [Wilcoxina mikolae CBS 423.85]